MNQKLQDQTLSVRDYKYFSRYYTPSPTKICNLSISMGIFPRKWKEASVCPLHKGGDIKKCNNYRPISIL